MQSKGRVERAIRYVRDNFFPARKFADLDDLNVQAEAWSRGLAADRRCPGQDTLSVREAFAAEAPKLLALPDNPYPLIERVAVSRRCTFRICSRRTYIGSFFVKLRGAAAPIPSSWSRRCARSSASCASAEASRLTWPPPYSGWPTGDCLTYPSHSRPIRSSNSCAAAIAALHPGSVITQSCCS